MNINRINSRNYSDKDIGKSQKSQTTDSAGTSSSGSRATDKPQGDRFSPSGTSLDGDIERAAAELRKLRDHSFSSLKNIRRKIKEGAYDTGKVHREIGRLVEKDIGSMDALLAGLTDSGKASDSKTISEEYKNHLIENPSVVQKVADKIAADLNRI